MVSCSQDMALKTWKRRKGLLFQSYVEWDNVQTLEFAHDRAIFSVDWDQKNTDRIASGGGDNAISVWTRPNDGSNFGRALLIAQAHEQDVNCVRWNPSRSNILASVGDEGLCKVWEIVPV